MDPAPANVLILRRIGVVALAAVLACTGLLMAAHLACAHGGAGEESHQDCKICKKYSHNSAVPILTFDAPVAGPPILLAKGPEMAADSLVAFQPRGRGPPAPCSIS